MKHPRRLLPLFAVWILVSSLGAHTTFDRYHTPAELSAAFRDIDRVTNKKYRPEIQFLTVPGFGLVEHQFLVAGRGEITIR